jgi:hypothetical protein
MHATAAALLCALAAVLLPAGALAQAPQPALTAADVRRIALASAPGAGGSSCFGAASSGLQQAVELGIPVDYDALHKDPSLAEVRCCPAAEATLRRMAAYCSICCGGSPCR